MSIDGKVAGEGRLANQGAGKSEFVVDVHMHF